MDEKLKSIPDHGAAVILLEGLRTGDIVGA